MNLESQVISLDLAKKLKSLNVKQESLFKWAEYPHIMQFKEETGKHECVETRFEIMGTSYWREDHIDKWSAFTVAELGSFFDANIVSGKDFFGGYFCRAIGKDDTIAFSDKSEANARAKVLIHFLENKLTNEE